MQKLLALKFLLLLSSVLNAQDRFPGNSLSINGFRNPSIGLEYQRYRISFHGGYYLTNFTSGITTEFLRAGFSCWFLPLGKKDLQSSFYTGISYLRGLTRAYKAQNVAGLEAGFRWYVWKGLNLRLGVIVLAGAGHSIKINPTPSVSYTIKF
jgi:hypothetical protein